MSDEAKFSNHGTVGRKCWDYVWIMNFVNMASYCGGFPCFVSHRFPSWRCTAISFATQKLPYRIFFHSWLSSLLDRYLNISVSSTLFSFNNNCCPIKSFIFPQCEYLRSWMSVYEASFGIPYFLLLGIFIYSRFQLHLEVWIKFA